VIEILSITLVKHINVKSVGLRTSFNFYPECPQPELVLGITPHADTSFVTVLQQDETPGLEIERKGQWIQVPPTADALVVNVGDLLQVNVRQFLQRGIIPN